MNRFTGEKITDETAHIKQSIADILLTPIGSRIQRRDYGSRPMNHALLLQLAAASVMALTKWEPRIQISKFQPRISENGIVCTIVARKRNNNQNVNFDDLFLGGKQ